MYIQQRFLYAEQPPAPAHTLLGPLPWPRLYRVHSQRLVYVLYASGFRQKHHPKPPVLPTSIFFKAPRCPICLYYLVHCCVRFRPAVFCAAIPRLSRFLIPTEKGAAVSPLTGGEQQAVHKSEPSGLMVVDGIPQRCDKAGCRHSVHFLEEWLPVVQNAVA